VKGQGFGASGKSIKGPGSGGDDGAGVGVTSGLTGAGEALSVIGVTKAGAGIFAWCVDTETPEEAERKEIVASDQLINRLMQLSQLYPRTKSQGESRWVTKNSRV
jgi:hypothetical protein